MIGPRVVKIEFVRLIAKCSHTRNSVIQDPTKYNQRFNWSQTDAAEALRVPLSTLNQKIKRLNIDVKRRGEKTGN